MLGATQGIAPTSLVESQGIARPSLVELQGIAPPSLVKSQRQHNATAANGTKAPIGIAPRVAGACAHGTESHLPWLCVPDATAATRTRTWQGDYEKFLIACLNCERAEGVVDEGAADAQADALYAAGALAFSLPPPHPAPICAAAIQ